MTVKELIAQLEAFDPKLEVYFAHPSHDYWRHELASPVEGVDEEHVKYSKYHSQMTTTEKDDDYDDTKDDEEKPADGTQLVLVLR